MIIEERGASANDNPGILKLTFPASRAGGEEFEAARYKELTARQTAILPELVEQLAQQPWWWLNDGVHAVPFLLTGWTKRSSTVLLN